MTVEGTRLQRRLDSLRRGRAGALAAEARGEGDPDIRARIEAIFRAADAGRPPQPVWQNAAPVEPASLARRLAVEGGSEAIETAHGWHVRRELRPVYLPLDRTSLARLPGMPDAATPLLCLDTETTGLGSAAGTVAFLVGLGRWEGDRLRLVQLALPDHSEEPALLDALAAFLEPDAWLVTYNGRGFDWPLLETRFRMGRRPVPVLAGHLDLLPLMRRLFRHRLPDARLQTVERHLLRRVRPPDVPSWQIPSLYHAFLRGADAAPIRVVARHNAEDVVSLGRLLVHLESGYARPERRPFAPPGDVLGLGRAFRAAGCLGEAIDCLTIACQSAESGERQAGLAALELGRLLRRLDRFSEAGDVWRRLGRAPGDLGALAWVELAKDAEHRQADLAAAWRATELALLALLGGEALVAAPGLGRRLEADIGRRRARLARRLGNEDPSGKNEALSGAACGAVPRPACVSPETSLPAGERPERPTVPRRARPLRRSRTQRPRPAAARGSYRAPPP